MAKRSKRKPATVKTDSGGNEAETSSAELVRATWVMMLLRVAVIIGAGLWVYSPVFHGDWLWDDDWYITNNTLLRDASGLWKFWFQPGVWVEYYPLDETVLWIEWHLFGSDTLGYHLVTIALHLVNALLVWRLLAKFGLPKAWLGGLIFAVHPACVDSVAWIVELKNTLSLGPFLLAMGAWVDYEESKSTRSYWLALVFFTASLLGKISAAPFPLVILIYAWWKRRRIDSGDAVASAPFFAVSLGLVALSIACGPWYYQSLHEIPEALPPLNYPARLALAGQTLAFYFAHCFWPVGLLPNYPMWKVDPSSLLQFLAWPIVAGVLYLLWQRRAGWGRHALLGMGFFLAFIAPFLGFVVPGYMAFTWVMDHYLYIPLIGIIGLVVAAIGSIEKRIPLTARPALTGSVTILIALLAFVANGYAVAFSDEATLWGYTVQHNPDDWRAHDNLGKAYLLMDQPRAAIPEFAAVLHLRPGRSETLLNLGRCYVDTDELDEGLTYYDRALALNPGDPDIYNQKGVALMQDGQFAQALLQFEAAIRLRPNYAIALDNMGSALAQSGDLPEALPRFEQALKIEPDDLTTLDNYGSALMQSGRNEEALAVFQHALRVAPADPKALEGVEKLRAGAAGK